MSTQTVKRGPAAPEQLSELELESWVGFLRAHAILTARLDAELRAAHQLPLSAYEVLLFLARAPDGRLRMAELARSVLLTQSGITRLVDRLEAGGLVQRESCTDDRRGQFAVVTSEGRKRFRAAHATHLAGVRSLFLGHFSNEELGALGAAWQRLLGGRFDAPDARATHSR